MHVHASGLMGFTGTGVIDIPIVFIGPFSFQTMLSISNTMPSCMRGWLGLAMHEFTTTTTWGSRAYLASEGLWGTRVHRSIIIEVYW